MSNEELLQSIACNPIELKGRVRLEWDEPLYMLTGNANQLPRTLTTPRKIKYPTKVIDAPLTFRFQAYGTSGSYTNPQGVNQTYFAELETDEYYLILTIRLNNQTEVNVMMQYKLHYTNEMYTDTEYTGLYFTTTFKTISINCSYTGYVTMNGSTATPGGKYDILLDNEFVNLTSNWAYMNIPIYATGYSYQALIDISRPIADTLIRMMAANYSSNNSNDGLCLVFGAPQTRYANSWASGISGMYLLDSERSSRIQTGLYSFHYASSASSYYYNTTITMTEGHVYTREALSDNWTDVPIEFDATTGNITGTVDNYDFSASFITTEYDLTYRTTLPSGAGEGDWADIFINYTAYALDMSEGTLTEDGLIYDLRPADVNLVNVGRYRFVGKDTSTLNNNNIDLFESTESVGTVKRMFAEYDTEYSGSFTVYYRLPTVLKSTSQFDEKPPYYEWDDAFRVNMNMTAQIRSSATGTAVNEIQGNLTLELEAPVW